MNIISKVINKAKRILYCISNKKKVKVMDSLTTIEYISMNKLSIGRYGDGELAIMNGKSIDFQEHNILLEQKLKEVKSNERFLTCIPSVFSKKTFNKNLLKENEYKFWKAELGYNQYSWIKYFKNIQPLGDAFISRFYLRYNKFNVQEYLIQIKKLWDNRDLVFVEGEKSRIGVGNDLFSNAKSVSRVVCPSINAFSKYDEIISYIKENISTDKLLILALGPTATVLSYDLSKLGYQALDLGHIDIEYEWFLMGATEKVPVKGKYVNETKEGRNPDAITSEEYYKQIEKQIL